MNKMDDCCNSAGNVSNMVTKSPNLRYGKHVRTRSTLSETIIENDVLFQCFLGSPKTYEVKFYDDEDKKLAKVLAEMNRTSIYVHAPYTAGFANPNKGIARRSKGVIVDIMRNISELPSSVVMHIGSNPNRQEGVQSIVNTVNELINERELISYHTNPRFKLLLENSAGGGDKIGTWDELRKMYEGFDRCQVGMCLDTQHIFASGMNKCQTHEDICRLFEDCYNIGGLYPDMFHLNDSMTEFNSKHDKHESLKDGYIWFENDEGLRYLKRFCRELEIDMISETPNPWKDEDVLGRLMEPY